jgi:hypothetical protein
MSISLFYRLSVSLIALCSLSAAGASWAQVPAVPDYQLTSEELQAIITVEAFGGVVLAAPSAAKAASTSASASVTPPPASGAPRDARPADSSTAFPSPPPAPPVYDALLLLSVDQDVSVWINDQARGRVSAQTTRKIPVSSGSIRVKLKSDAGAELQLNQQVSAGQKTQVAMQFPVSSAAPSPAKTASVRKASSGKARKSSKKRSRRSSRKAKPRRKTKRGVKRKVIKKKSSSPRKKTKTRGGTIKRGVIRK